MFRARHCLVACIGLGCQPSKVVGYGEFEADAVQHAVYDTVELTFKLPEVNQNPFTIFARVTFTRRTERFVVEGFYDGNARDGAHVWRARFMPNQAGRWRYEWQLEHERGDGDIDISERRDPDSHGHVRIDTTRPSVLWHDDGTVHYWTGGKWFSAKNYGPLEKQGELNDSDQDGSRHDSYYTDHQFETYLDELKANSHNGALLKIGYYPLENDGVSWDLDWIRRADRWIQAMRKRHIYCQINLFDPWSRSEGSWFDYSENPNEHVLNAWDVENENADGQADEDDLGNDGALQNYVRYVIARFSGYANVYWELANRIDYFGEEAGDEFVRQARDKYLVWFQEYDPYHLPIGASEVSRARQLDSVSIEFPRDTTRPPSSDSRRALIVNELVHTCEGANGTTTPAHDDATIRHPESRLCYRAAFWRSFVFGAFGTNEASWLDLTLPLDNAVREVMGDHERLRRLAFGLETSLDQLVPNPGVVISASGHIGTRGTLGETYVSYFMDCNAESIEMDLKPGEYRVRWVYPGDNADTRAQVGYAIAGAEPVRLERPNCDPDLVLVLERDRSAPR